MELKSKLDTNKYFNFSCSNRTFMELKSAKAARPAPALLVLIVPLWN